MSEEAYESGGEEATEEQALDYDNESESSEENYQERPADDKSVRSKAESKLEKKLDGRLRRISREADNEFYDGGNIEDFIDRELTEEEKAALEEELREARYFPAGLNSVDGYIKFWNSQEKATLKDGIKGLWYLIKGFIDVEAEEDKDVYEKITRMRNSPILYISGALEYPMSIREVEEHSGYDIAHIKERMDPDRINDIVEYTIRVTGQKPILIGFSDGGKSIESYIEKYGMNRVSMFYAIAASKFDAEDPNKVVFIDGKKDRIFILEQDAFKKTSSPVFKVDGGHTWTCYDPLTIRQIFDIIERTARVERHNFETAKKAD